MATLSRGTTYGATETITNTKLHLLVDGGSVTGIVNADCSGSMALANSKLANITDSNKVSGSSFFALASIPAGAGVIPYTNVPSASLVSIPNISLLPLTLASWVGGGALRNLSSLPSLAGQVPWFSVVSSLASGGITQYNGSNLIGRNISDLVPDELSDYANGTTYTEVTAATERSTSSGTYAKLKELSPLTRAGRVTITWEHKSSGGDTVNTRLYINGVAVGSEKSSTSTSYAEVSESDVAVALGDLIQVYGKRPGASDSFAKNLKLKCTNPIPLQEAT